MDEGETWTECAGDWPEGLFFSSIDASRVDEGTAYITVNGKRHNDFTTYVYKTTDYGTTWMNIASDCPGGCANVIKEDPENGNILYLGTDLAVYVSLDAGQTWEVLGTGLPTVYVHDIAVHLAEDLLVIATHGRSSWVVDLRPVRAAAGN